MTPLEAQSAESCPVPFYAAQKQREPERSAGRIAVECTRCSKWRLVNESEGAEDDDKWECALNDDAAHNTCAVAQEMSNSEMDTYLGLPQSVAGEEVVMDEEEEEEDEEDEDEEVGEEGGGLASERYAAEWREHEREYHGKVATRVGDVVFTAEARVAAHEAAAKAPPVSSIEPAAALLAMATTATLLATVSPNRSETVSQSRFCQISSAGFVNLVNAATPEKKAFGGAEGFEVDELD